jgi:hypothetical protein
MTWLTPQYLSRLEALELSVKWVKAGRSLGGRYPINRRGSSIEFADYAPYAPGDDIRAIDWNLYARLDRLFIKTYKEEITLAVEFLVDATASMGLPGMDKFVRASRLAVSLGYIALSDRHRVRLSWLRPGALAASPLFFQRGDLWRMNEAAERVTPGGQVAWPDWMRRAATTLRWHGGQAIVISDGMVRPAELFRALHLLTLRHMEVKFIQVITPQELHPSAVVRGGRVVDAETGAAQQLGYPAAVLDRAMHEHNELLARFCLRRGIFFAQHRTDQPLEAFITKTLPGRGLLR